MTKEEIKEYILKNPRGWNSNKDIKKIISLKDVNISNNEFMFLYCYDIERPECRCGSYLRFLSFTQGYAEYCTNSKCIERKKIIQRYKEETSLNNYGVTNPMMSKEVISKQKVTCPIRKQEIQKKREQTCVSKYGVDNPAKHQEFKTKSSNSYFEKTGYHFPTQNPEVKQKQSENNLRKYGATSYLKTDESIFNRKQTLLSKYGVDNPAKVEEFKSKQKTTTWERYFEKHKDSLSFIPVDINKPLEIGDLVTHKDCGCVEEYYFINGPSSFYCRKCNPVFSNISKGEKEIVDYIRSIFHGDIIENDRSIISPKELDIYIPSRNLAIEYNGLFWHSSRSLLEESTYKNKHLIKTELSEKCGINLFHITDFEWFSKKNIIKSMIKQKLGLSKRIFARQCEIKSVPNNEAIEFQELNHLKGSSVSSVNLGLYFQKELVCLMTFGKPRFNKSYEWELIRFCNKLDYTVVGGASKLFKNFRKKNKGNIISYADRSHSIGGLYDTLGFTQISTSDPSYFWIYKSAILSRYKTQKHKLKEILGDLVDKNKSESENMYDSGAIRYFDCGTKVFAILQ